MTPQEQQDLAKWAVEFLRWKKGENGWWSPPEDEPNWLQENEYHDRKLCNIFFEPNYINNEPPILMHLGKREMKKHGYVVEQTDDFFEDGETEISSCLIRLWGAPDNWRSTNKNIFIAFWSAVRKAVEG